MLKPETRKVNSKDKRLKDKVDDKSQNHRKKRNHDKFLATLDAKK